MCILGFCLDELKSGFNKFNPYSSEIGYGWLNLCILHSPLAFIMIYEVVFVDIYFVYSMLCFVQLLVTCVGISMIFESCFNMMYIQCCILDFYCAY